MTKAEWARRENEPEPKRLEDLTAPAWLKGEAKMEWERIAPILSRLGLLTESDSAALVAYCQAWATWKTATVRLRKRGLVNGGMPSPYVKIADSALVQMRALLSEFGMTPSARARVQVTKAAATASKVANLK